MSVHQTTVLLSSTCETLRHNLVYEIEMKCQQCVKRRTRQNLLAIQMFLFLMTGTIVFYNYRNWKVTNSSPVVTSLVKSLEKESVANEKLHAFVDNLIKTKSELMFGNNETGSDQVIVPNIIHYVRFNKTLYILLSITSA
jgi:hypothetical protein